MINYVSKQGLSLAIDKIIELYKPTQPVKWECTLNASSWTGSEDSLMTSSIITKKIQNSPF